MKFKEVLKRISPTNEGVLRDYLTQCGIENCDLYLNVNTNNGFEYDYFDYDHMREAVEIFLKYQGKDIYIVSDPDVDGILSTAILLNFCDKLNINAHPLVHEGKIHGLADEDIMDYIIHNPLELVIIPDASGSEKQCKKLKEAGVKDIIILDHHPVNLDNTEAIIVNTHIPTNGVLQTNKDLSGTGVVYKFVIAVCYTLKIDVPYYIDLVACSILSDVCDLRSNENHYYVQHGLNNINNTFLNELVRELDNNEDKSIPESVVWNIVPKLNAVMRSDDTVLKSTLLWLFAEQIDGIDVDNIIKELKKWHRKQQTLTKKWATDLEATLNPNDKINVIFSEEPLGNYTGLVAGKITGDTLKPTILVHQDSSDNNKAIGSVRSPIPLLDITNDSGLFDWCEGHQSAYGVKLDKNKLYDLQLWGNNLTLDTDPAHEVIRVYNNPNLIPEYLFAFGNEYKDLWGKGISYPMFGIRDIEIYGNDIYEIGRNKTTIKFNYQGVDFIKFLCSKEVRESLYIGQKKKLYIDVVGKLEYKVYNGVVNKQIVIDSFDVKTNKESQNWSDLF